MTNNIIIGALRKLNATRASWGDKSHHVCIRIWWRRWTFVVLSRMKLRLVRFTFEWYYHHPWQWSMDGWEDDDSTAWKRELMSIFHPMLYSAFVSAMWDILIWGFDFFLSQLFLINYVPVGQQKSPRLTANTTTCLLFQYISIPMNEIESFFSQQFTVGIFRINSMSSLDPSLRLAFHSINFIEHQFGDVFFNF